MNQNGSGELPKKPKKNMAVEKIYQKKSQLEHILLRPDTYIGSVSHHKELMWVFDHETDSMVQKEISYVPGLYKIFDEILVNAADNKQRDPKMDCIMIDIEPEDNTISIWNNGKGIPVVEHKDENMYVPTMIFGHLLTSSNYNDEEEKVTGGRNGYGAKLCNIFSTSFTVETSSKEYKRSFKQTWMDNMSKTKTARVTASSGDDFTRVTFKPDLTKFTMESLDADIIALMSRRAYDIAASVRGVKVKLNGKRLQVKSFKDYIEMYIKGKEDGVGNPLKVVHEVCSPRWEVAVTQSDNSFQQVSFVNSIATTKGGRHVEHVADYVCKQLLESIKKKNKGGVPVRAAQVKNNMWLFVNCLIVNPTFDSQTKENMTLQVKNFGSKFTPSDKFTSSVTKCGIVESVLTWTKFQEQRELQKTCNTKKKNKITGIPKLEDANDAGSAKSLDCTLILTEGDSAKSLAVSGLGVVGRDKYGVFPLRGKLLNVREASHKQICHNAEINSIVKIMGLQYKKLYENELDLKTLRYGKLMIMTDQDQDGSHIKGLIINFLHYNWPTLLRLPFLEEFITPIVKVFKGKNELSFYSLPELEEWKSATDNWHTYRIKYYKGLGTSTSKEAKEYFSDMNRHRIIFNYSGQRDDTQINMAFSKKCSEDRKVWLTTWMEDSKRRKELGLSEQYLYEKNTRSVTFSDFINKELVLFSNCDNERSIPSMVDGLKPGQRKVIFTCFKRNDKREVKVAQLAGSVAEHSSYHHGEVSLMSTIINLAQNFVGSNNINLLQPIGQFGTRLNGGKDAASPRYIFTQLSPLAKVIFHPHDEPLLKSQYDDNQKIEPLWYLPIIPMILVNGAEGIGTGWMTKIPNYNPREVVSNIMRLLDNEEPRVLTPWYKNFLGTIEPVGIQRYVMHGEISEVEEGKVEITELPVGTWTQSYKESVLEPMLPSEKAPAVCGSIIDFKEYHTDTTVKFVVSMAPDKLSQAEDTGLHKFFKLQSTMTTSSMCAFDENCVLRRLDSAEEILLKFYKLRLEYYEKRKNYLEGVLEAESLKLSNQARFIVEKCDGTLVVENKKKVTIIGDLRKKGFDPDPVRLWKIRQNKEEALVEQQEEQGGPNSQDEGEADDDMSEKGHYNYLLGLSMWTLTLEKKNELLKQRDEKLQDLTVIKDKSPPDLWREDLNHFLEELNRVEALEKDEEMSAKAIKVAPKKGSRITKKPIVEYMPSPQGRRIAPRIDEDLKKKYEKAAQSAISKKEGKSKRGKKGDEEKDEFDLMGERPIKSLLKRLGSPGFKSTAQIIREARRKARENLKSDDESNHSETSRSKPEISESDSDSGPRKKKKKVPTALSSDDMFNSLISRGNDMEVISSSDNSPEKRTDVGPSTKKKQLTIKEAFKKSGPKKKPVAARKRKPLDSNSDSDDDMFEPWRDRSGGTELPSDVEGRPTKRITTSRRVTKPVKYIDGLDSDCDDD